MSRYNLLFCFLILPIAFAFSQQPRKNIEAVPLWKYNLNTDRFANTASRAGEQVSIDGILQEQIWQRPGYDQFTQRDPDESKPPSQRTEVWLAYDDNALYVAARMHDTAPDSLITRLSRRDASWNSDMFAFFVDPYLDRRTGNYFALDAAGTYYDGVLYNDDWDDDSWDGVWEGNVHSDSLGWTAEMRIPLSQLRFQQQEEYVWGVNFRRDVARRNERNYVVMTPRNESGFVSRFADLTGIRDITPVQRVEILPYITTQAQFTQHATGDPFNDGSKYTPRVGADLKVGIGSNLTLDGTVNPDFGQVEIDPAVVNLSDVETSFQEKRPFFIEGINIFRFGQGGTNNNWNFNWSGVDFFYSRRIGRSPQGSIPGADYADIPSGTDILGAAKLTGKIGGNWNVGTIQALTRREFAKLETSGQRSEAEVEPLTYYGITRATAEFDEGRHSIGFISTIAARSFSDQRLRDQINKDAFVGGVDGWTTLDDDRMWVLAGWASVTRVSGNQTRMINLQRNSRHYFQRPDAGHVSVDSSATSLTGYAGRVRLNKQKGKFYMNAALGFLNPKFEVNDAGFVGRSDLINGHVVVSYRWNEPTETYRFFELGGSAFRSYDFDGNKTWDGFFHFGNFQFLNFYSINWSGAYNPQTVNNRRTRGGPLTLNPPGYQADISASSDQNKSVVYDLGYSTYQSRSGTSNSVYGGISWRPTTSISISFSPSFDRNIEAAQYVGSGIDPTATATFGSRYVFAQLDQSTASAGIRLNWTFTPKLSLQLYAQPLISSGNYELFKELARPKSYDFNVFGETNSTITRNGDEYTVDPDGVGPAAAFTIGNPDFNFVSLRGNAVLRWEYLPGSVVYFVWTQSRADFTPDGEFKFGHSFDRLLSADTDNIFMVKMTYWWSN